MPTVTASQYLAQMHAAAEHHRAFLQELDEMGVQVIGDEVLCENQEQSKQVSEAFKRSYERAKTGESRPFNRNF